MLLGLTPPYTATGRSALVAPPPWHFAGQILSLAFPVDADRARDFTPANVRATGRAAIHVCEWQATSDGSELLDPVYAQYRELFTLIEVGDDDRTHWHCPFIYVDQDISMARGWLQGWPKKLGSIAMTRAYALDHPAAANPVAGTRLAASLAVKDRRLADIQIRLTGAPAEPIGFLAGPVIGQVATPSLLYPQATRPVRTRVSQRVDGPAYGATGQLHLYPAPRDELAELAPSLVTAASLSTLGLTFAGIEAA